MAQFDITTPDGKKYRVTAPDGATQEEVLAYAQQNAGNATSAPVAPEKAPSFADRAKRVAGLGARAVVEGVAGIPALLAEVPAAVLRTGIRAVTGAETFPSPTATLQRNLTAAGLPEPENATERLSTAVTGSLVSQGGLMKVGDVLAKSAGPVVSRIGDLLRSQPGLQTATTATGTTAARIAAENDVGPLGQFAASVLGGMVPAVAVTAGAPMTVRGMLRGGEQGRQRVADNIKLFEEAGYGSPSVGQASEGRFARAVESGVSKTPGGAGRMGAAAEAGSSNLGERVTGIADTLSPGATATKAGATIEKGVRSFVERFRGEQKYLYDKLDTHIPKQSQVDMTNTVNALSALNADIPGAPALSQFFKNETIQAIETAMKSDTGDFTRRLPYEALKKLRTLVGNELENTSLTSSVPRSKWKTLYAALSQDLGEAATAAGPDAQKAFSRANTYTAAGHERIGTFLDRVAGKDTVEKVFQAAVNPSELKEGASTLNAVIRSLEPNERSILKAAFIKRLGQATAGKQDDLGEVFSPETFLTNWNKISPEAKVTLFAGGDGTLRRDLDQIAKVASNIREGSKVFANPSGTQQAISSQMAGGGALVAILTGNLPVAAGIGATALGANATARLMTNPKFVKWLAQATHAPTGAIPGELNVLAGIAQKMGAEDRAPVDQFIEAARTQAGQSR